MTKLGCTQGRNVVGFSSHIEICIEILIGAFPGGKGTGFRNFNCFAAHFPIHTIVAASVPVINGFYRINSTWTDYSYISTCVWNEQ